MDNEDYLPSTDDAFYPASTVEDGTLTFELEEYTEGVDCSADGPCYVAAGSNNIPPVQVEVDKINPSEAQKPSYIDGSTGILYQSGVGTELVNIADRTDTEIGYFDVFRNFPTGTNSGGGVGDDSGSEGQIRNPLEVCRTVLQDCPS